MSLYALENDVIRPLGDERVHFALNCMSVSCPRLPRQPFRADNLNRQLDDAARQFFAEPRNLQVVTERKLVRVSSILEFYTQDFLAHSLNLVAYINKYASKSIPGDYRIEFLDYDWNVNDQRNLRMMGSSAPPCGSTRPIAVACMYPSARRAFRQASARSSGMLASSPPAVCGSKISG